MIGFPSRNRDKFKLDEYEDELWSGEDWILGILCLCANYKRKIWPSRIAGLLGLHRQRVSRHLDKLVREDLVREELDPRSLRQVYEVTAKGRTRQKLKTQELLRALREEGYSDGSLGGALLSYGMFVSTIGILKSSFDQVARVLSAAEEYDLPE